MIGEREGRKLPRPKIQGYFVSVFEFDIKEEVTTAECHIQPAIRPPRTRVLAAPLFLDVGWSLIRTVGRFSTPFFLM